LGNRFAANANGMNGKMSEVVMVSSTLPTDDRQKLEGYLAWKWGLTANLPVDHPYKTTPPTV
jgi:trimeric autotransporter adhesin